MIGQLQRPLAEAARTTHATTLVVAPTGRSVRAVMSDSIMVSRFADGNSMPLSLKLLLRHGT